MRSEWTLDSAMTHLLELRRCDMEMYTSNRTSDQLRNEQRFIAQEKAVEAALSSAKTATEKAETAAERRFDSVNEFRAALSTQQSTYITRIEVKTTTDNQSSKIDTIASNQGACVTRVEMFSWVAVASVVGGVIGHFIR